MGRAGIFLDPPLGLPTTQGLKVGGYWGAVFGNKPPWNRKLIVLVGSASHDPLFSFGKYLQKMYILTTKKGRQLVSFCWQKFDPKILQHPQLKNHEKHWPWGRPGSVGSVGSSCPAQDGGNIFRSVKIHWMWAHTNFRTFSLHGGPDPPGPP